MKYDNKPEAECLLKYAEERINKKKGIIFLFTGGTGDGKSYAGLRFLELWYKKWFDESFETKNVCNSLEEAILIVKNFKRIGEGILIEELSVHLSRRQALTTSNVLFNKFVDICRIKQAVIVANAPHISFIDSHFQMMCQAWVNCERVDFKNKVVLAHPLWLQTSPHKKEPYKHRFLNKDDEPIDLCFFRLPNKKLIEDYDKSKEESNEKIFDEIILKLRADRDAKLKKLGQKKLSQQETKTYRCYTRGLTTREGAKEMKIKEQTYRNYLKTTKNKLKEPEYSEYAKTIEEFNKSPEKNPKTT